MAEISVWRLSNWVAYSSCVSQIDLINLKGITNELPWKPTLRNVIFFSSISIYNDLPLIYDCWKIWPIPLILSFPCSFWPNSEIPFKFITVQIYPRMNLRMIFSLFFFFQIFLGISQKVKAKIQILPGSWISSHGWGHPCKYSLFSVSLLFFFVTVPWFNFWKKPTKL